MVHKVKISDRRTEFEWDEKVEYRGEQVTVINPNKDDDGLVWVSLRVDPKSLAKLK
jgi:hypothetical protein